MKIVYKDPKELKDYENNPRIIDNAIMPVMESIKEYGFRVPIIIDTQDNIIAGHIRKIAAIKLSIHEIPCVYADGMTQEQIRAFRIVENKTHEFASWDFKKLEEELQNIDIDLSVFQFPDLEEDLLLSDMDFLQAENIPDKKPKIVICPTCGEEIEI